MCPQVHVPEFKNVPSGLPLLCCPVHPQPLSNSNLQSNNLINQVFCHPMVTKLQRLLFYAKKDLARGRGQF